MIYNEYHEGMKKKIVGENSNGKIVKINIDLYKMHIPEEAPKAILVKSDLQVLIGGYWNGMMVIQNFDKKQEIGKKKHLCRITMIQASLSEEVIITGTEKGDIVKWNNREGEIKFETIMFHHQQEVTGWCIHEEMGIFATWSKDGTANLYRISPAYIIRSFEQPDGYSLGKVFISESPLASLIMCKFLYLINIYSVPRSQTPHII